MLPTRDVPIGISLKFFGQQPEGAIFLSVGQNLLSTKLVAGLADVHGLDAQVIISSAATDLRKYVGAEYLVEVLSVYNDALDDIFRVAIVLACLSFAGVILTDWKSVKGKNLKGA